MRSITLPENMELPDFVRGVYRWNMKIEGGAVYAQLTTLNDPWWVKQCAGPIVEYHDCNDFMCFVAEQVAAKTVPTYRPARIAEMRQQLTTILKIADTLFPPRAIEAMRKFTSEIK